MIQQNCKHCFLCLDIFFALRKYVLPNTHTYIYLSITCLNSWMLACNNWELYVWRIRKILWYCWSVAEWQLVDGCRSGKNSYSNTVWRCDMGFKPYLYNSLNAADCGLRLLQMPNYSLNYIIRNLSNFLVDSYIHFVPGVSQSISYHSKYLFVRDTAEQKYLWRTIYFINYII